MTKFTTGRAERIVPPKAMIEITAVHVAGALSIGVLIGFFAGLTITEIQKANTKAKINFHEIHYQEHIQDDRG